MRMADGLKPCPFCGGKAEVSDVISMRRDGKTIKCTKCNARSKYVFIDSPILNCNGLDESTRYTAEQAVAIVTDLWNRRTALPCKIGDVAWGIRSYKGVLVPQQGKVSNMFFTDDMKLCIVVQHICRGEWGKKVFATKEEAELALAEMKRSNQCGVLQEGE